MKRNIRLFCTLAIVVSLASSCKSKQQITEVPPGANLKATATTSPKQTTSNESSTAVVESTDVKSKAGTAATTKPNSGQVTNNTASAAEPEVTRNENFTLVEGESDAFKSKYHVVVGSFTKAENARGLQSTLKNAGSHAMIVKNESGKFRVLIASFNDYVKAHEYIKQISGQFPDAWVLKQK